MEYVMEMNFCAPLYQVGLLLLLISLTLLFGKAKLGLLITYLFTLYWAYVFDRDYLLTSGTKHAAYFPWLYFGFGFTVFFLALFAFLTNRE